MQLVSRPMGRHLTPAEMQDQYRRKAVAALRKQRKKRGQIGIIEDQVVEDYEVEDRARHQKEEDNGSVMDPEELRELEAKLGITSAKEKAATRIASVGRMYMGKRTARMHLAAILKVQAFARMLGGRKLAKTRKGQRAVHSIVARRIQKLIKRWFFRRKTKLLKKLILQFRTEKRQRMQAEFFKRSKKRVRKVRKIKLIQKTVRKFLAQKHKSHKFLQTVLLLQRFVRNTVLGNKARPAEPVPNKDVEIRHPTRPMEQKKTQIHFSRRLSKKTNRPIITVVDEREEHDETQMLNPVQLAKPIQKDLKHFMHQIQRQRKQQLLTPQKPIKKKPLPSLLHRHHFK